MSKRPLKVPTKKFHKTFDQNGIPLCLCWSVSDVEQWVELELKLPQYKECFANNFISGKKLISMEASNLPRIGITDFEHIKLITSKIRELLGINEPEWNRSITLPPRDTVEHFIERKSHTGKESEALTFDEHERFLKKFNQHGVLAHSTQWSD